MTDSTFKRIHFQLLKNKTVFQALFEGLEEQEYLWRPEKGKWIMLEILCHLLDEEREDFKVRMKSVLKNPEESLPKIDPAGWVISRSYASQNYNDTLNAFLKERDQSLKWLKGLSNPLWKNAFQHPHFGPMSAELFYTNWLAHDQRHIEQIIRLKYAYLKHISTESLDYAG